MSENTLTPKINFGRIACTLSYGKIRFAKQGDLHEHYSGAV